ncbi:MAG: nucleotide sugar dehydrogenase [Thermoleophilia bacterium]
MDLIERIEAHEARVGIIGQGYVGLPLSLLFGDAGFAVTAFDIDPDKTEALNNSRSYIAHIGSERVASARARAKDFYATTDLDGLAQCDAILICLPTPLGRHREPDLSYILNAAHEIADRLHAGQLVILESTTYPGTTDEEIQPILEATGLETPRDFWLAFSPEREDPGNAQFCTEVIPKIVGGVNPESTRMAAALYGEVLQSVVPVSSSRVAEASKLLENIYRAVNIALVNELKTTFDRMDIDVWEVIEAAKTKPFGFQAFYPGPGLGGHCIPLDPFYLSWKAAEYGVWARFIELAGEINTSMPAWVISKVVAALSDDGKSLRGAKVLVLGLSYKPDIDDDRESPSYELIQLLRKRGAEVSYCDPHFPETKPTRRHELELQSVPLTPEEFARYDLVLLSTAHAEFYDPSLYRETKLVVDTRNVVKPGWGPRVVKA